MEHLSIDIETYSSVDLKPSGVHKYTESGDFEILLFAYSIDFGEVKIVDLANGEQIPLEILKALNDQNVIKHAYNATFEYHCLTYAGYITSIDQWHCSMFHGLYCGYIAGLGALGKALGLPQNKQKDKQGETLIKIFCHPCKPTKTNGGRKRNLPKDEPENWELFKNYCIQDVVTEMEIYKRLRIFPVPKEEQELWVLDYKINNYGVRIDTDFLNGALSIKDVNTYFLKEEMKNITKVDNPNSTQQLKVWLASKGLVVDSIAKDVIEKQLKIVKDEEISRVMKLRQELAKTSLGKYNAMVKRLCKDGKAKGTLRFYGANRSGRWSGSSIQLQNLPRNYIKTLDLAKNITKEGNYNLLKFVYGNVSDTLSQLVRTAFMPSEGRKLIIADFSAIEARILSWLADEEWRLEVFRTHGKIYEASASQMFNVPIEKIVKGNPEYELRAKGKVAELALGYQGSEEALKIGGALDMGISEAELTEIKTRWRSTNPKIVSFWKALERAVLRLMFSGETQYIKNLIIRREYDLLYGQNFVTIELPSKRKLYYAKPFIGPGKFGNDSLHYYDGEPPKKKDGEEEKNIPLFRSVGTYGGKLVENVTQAIARDCLAVALKRLSHLDIVMHIHDEVVIDAPKNINCEDIFKIMGEPIEWAPDLLLKADGFESSYYMKD